MPFEFFMALRYLRAKRRSAFVSIITILSALGVAVGVMALIIVLAVMTGFEEDLKEKILGTNAHIMVTRGGEGIANYRSLMEELQRLPGVEAATPFTYNQVMIAAGSEVSGIVVRGIDPATDPRVTNLSQHLTRGSLKELEQTHGPSAMPGIIVGKELASNLGLMVGESISVISPLGTMTPVGMIPKMKNFRLVGIFDTGMLEYDTSLALISLPSAQAFFGTGDRVTGIQLRVTDIYGTGKLTAEINQMLDPSYVARDWMQMNRNILFALKTEKTMMFIILTLIILVAALGIASMMFMVVLEKARAIAILKSMGATGRTIMTIFVLEGLLIGVTGTVIGLVAGISFALNIQKVVDLIQRLTGWTLFNPNVYYLDHFPSRVVPMDVTVIALTAIAISLAATLYPAWQASRLAPAEALRYE
ncbi:MAG TPA: lipoprotein-releasing ABC transporter permease subunit [Geobacterales bacterium]|nr:lipoprotein-releasing ABC transporter permease subunit [Geobacterales bacterium]